MRSAIAATIAISALATPAMAAEKYHIDIKANKLSSAVNALSRQTGGSIGVMNVALSRYRVKPMKGRYTLQQALRLLLVDTDLDFKVIKGKTVRIIRKPQRTTLGQRRLGKKRARKRRTLPTKELMFENEPIIVTAAKLGISADDFAGSAHVLDVASNGPAAEGEGLDRIVRQLPTTAQTNLGTGRNKIFLRGIADSSLVGTAQSTIGMYLDEMRLAYNGANPDLRLYDVRRIEVVEGPQGTLYGAGSIGGIIRTQSHKPDLSEASATIWGGLALTQGGAASFDVAAMINLPVSDNMGLRVVGYAQEDGGFIDDVGRGLKNINRTRISGGRAIFRIELDEDWIVDAAGIYQLTKARDGQYVDANLDGLKRSTRFAQPFEASLASPSLTLSKTWDEFSLLSVSGYVSRRNRTFFDTGALARVNIPTLAFEAIASDFFTHETRFNWNSENGQAAVIGVSYLHNNDLITLKLGNPRSMQEISRFQNSSTELALFGQTSFPLNDSIVATVGGRLNYTHSTARAYIARTNAINPDRKDTRFLPMAALSSRLDENNLLYARYQQGFRAGGVSLDFNDITPFLPQFNAGGVPIASGPITLDSNSLRVESDTIKTIEAGWKFGQSQGSRVSGSISVYHSSWDNIQADLLSRDNFPETVNIGDGKSSGITASINWQPRPNVDVFGSIFINESELTDPLFIFDLAEKSRLPNIADLGGYWGATWRTPLNRQLDLLLSGNVRYVGESQIGLDRFFPIKQGNYATAAASAQVSTERWTVSLNIDNLLNKRANIFAFGNPFTIGGGNQHTPLRPRTVTLSSKISF